MGTDFFDDDLARGDDAKTSEARATSAENAVTTANGQLARHKEELIARAASSTNELDRLRRRQEDLEREKVNLENLTRRQEEYEQGKGEIIEKLERSVILVEKEEVQAAQMAEILATTRQRFRETLEELRGLDEDQWPADEVMDELNKAMALVEDARDVFKRGMAKVEASRWQETGGGKGERSRYDGDSDEALERASFAFWLKVGLAVTLPIVIVLLVIFVAFLILTGPGF